MSTKPKKAQTKAKEHKLPKNWGKVNGKIIRDEVLDTAIERGERLEKIAEILSVADQQSNNDDGSIDLDPKQAKEIYKLAKGA